MKQKLIAALVTSAIAGLAATTAHAGAIQASYKVFAAEAFGDTTLSLIAPTVGYSLNNPITGDAANPNTFVAKITLADGEWDTAVALPTAVLRDPSISNEKKAVFSGYEDAGKTAVFTFTVGATGSEAFPVGSTITFGSTTAADIANIKPLQAIKLDSKLKTPLDNACAPTEAQALATVKLYNASGTQFDTTEQAAVFASNVAVKATVVASSASTYGTKAEASKVDVLLSGKGKAFTNDADVTPVTTTIALGKVVVADRASLYDADGSNKYSVSDADWGLLVGKDGGVSAATLSLKVSGKFATGGNVFLASDEACTTGLGTPALSFNTDKTVATLSADVTGLALAASARTAYVCYTPSATVVIPTAQFAVTEGSLTKASGSKELANPVCTGNLYNLTANGVKIDVRNYIPASQTTASGWADVVRFINTDETQTATITAELIASTGELLGAGEVLTLAPRAVKYMSNADIEAKLPKTVTGAQGDNARLRVTSASSSLRVQNYQVNPVTGAVNEVSAAQGDEGYTSAAANNVDIPVQDSK